MGLLFVLLASGIFWTATFGLPRLPHQQDDDFYSHLDIYSNHPEIATEVNFVIDEESASGITDRQDAHIWLTFGSAALPADYKWALLGNQNLAFSAVADGQTGDLQGRINLGDYTPIACESGDRTGMGVLAEAILLGDATSTWIPGLEGSRDLSNDPRLDTTTVSFGARLPLADMRFDDVETYGYRVGWFGQSAADLSGANVGRYPESCLEFPNHGQLRTSAKEFFQLTVIADADRDRVVFAQPSAEGEGRAAWEDPAGVVRVTFESTDRRRTNAALLFLAGISVGLGTGVWAGALLEPHRPH